jgi:hypothetical protein
LALRPIVDFAVLSYFAFTRANLATQQLMRSEDKDPIQTLTASQLYKESERSFSEITGLPLALQPLFFCAPVAKAMGIN